MGEVLQSILLASVGLTADGLLLAALFWPCHLIGQVLERELCRRGYRSSPPDGRSGIIIFIALLVGVPAVIVLWGTLSGRLPP